MQELFLKVLDEVRGAWRFRWTALLVTWLICTGGWLSILLMPDIYGAYVRVFVDTRTTLSEVTQGMTVESNIETQIQRVRQSLLGGPELENVLRETGFPIEGLTPQQMQAQVERLQKVIEISGSTTRQSATGGVYTLSYRDKDRERARRVVEKLLDSFVAGTIGGNRLSAEQAQQFLVDQIKVYEQRLSGAEQRLARFKKENVGLMPGTQGDYFVRLQNEIDSVSAASDRLTIAERRRDELQRQLRGEQPMIAGPAIAAANSQGGVGDTASRIRDTEARLDELLLRFTERHPDVSALRDTIKSLKVRQQEESAALARGEPGSGAGMAANPVFQQIRLQLNQTEVEIAALRAEVADRQGKVAELRRLVNTAPEVEAELARLDRDYEVTRANYQALVERLERARLSEQAEETGAVEFEVIDPPTASFAPVAPKRGLLAIAVLFLAVGAGGGLAWVLHQLRPVFLSSRQLNEVTGLPVLGMVSMTWLEKHTMARLKGALVYAAAASLLLLTAVAMVVVQRPIIAMLQQML